MLVEIHEEKKLEIFLIFSVVPFYLFSLIGPLIFTSTKEVMFSPVMFLSVCLWAR